MRKVPKLRFKEFTDEWEEKKLGEVSKNRTYGLNVSAIEYDGENKYIRITDIDEENRNYKPSPLTSPSGKLDDNFLVKENDILFARTGASVGKTYHYNKNDGKLYFAGFLIRFNINKESSKFIFYNTLRKDYKKWVSLISMRTGQPGINAEEYKNYKLNLPSFQEQEKIANFLSSLDKKISLTEEKLELFKEYKKGIMQKIFSQELRFKDNEGNNYPEWKEKRLGEIGNTYNGLTGKNAEDFGKGKKYITYKNIYDNTKINIDILELVNIALGEKQNKVEYGDIFFTTSSETPNEVGYTSVLLAKVQEDIYLNSFCFGFRLENKIKYLPEFFRYLLRSQNFRNSIYILAQGSTRFNLSKIELLKLKILLPTSEEQEKIANFLSSIDTKIEKIEKELENLKEFKKCLLQQMFV